MACVVEVDVAGLGVPSFHVPENSTISIDTQISKTRNGWDKITTKFKIELLGIPGNLSPRKPQPGVPALS